MHWIHTCTRIIINEYSFDDFSFSYLSFYCKWKFKIAVHSISQKWSALSQLKCFNIYSQYTILVNDLKVIVSTRIYVLLDRTETIALVGNNWVSQVLNFTVNYQCLSVLQTFIIATPHNPKMERKKIRKHFNVCIFFWFGSHSIHLAS